MAHEHQPIKTSQVIVLNSGKATSHLPPPSPPSPATPCDTPIVNPLDDISSLSQLESKLIAPVVEKRLANAVHVLGTEATALSHITCLYETQPEARVWFSSAIDAIVNCHINGGKVVVSGVGKSGVIGEKLVATLNSLHIDATFLDATKAIHGDLGRIKEKADIVILITFSGATKELLDLLQHLPHIPLIVLTRHTQRTTCEIITRRPDCILLPAPIHVSETESHGFNAPTTSTTVALGLCDALAVVAAKEVHNDVAAIFARFHPGGAIGAASRAPRRLSEIAIPFLDIPDIDAQHHAATGAHVLVAAYKSRSRWVRQGDALMSPRRIEQIQTEDLEEPALCIRGLMVLRKDCVELPDTMEITQAKDLLNLRRRHGKQKYEDEGVIVIIDDDEVTGVLEIGELMKS